MQWGNLIATFNVVPGRENAAIFGGFDIAADGCAIFYSGFEFEMDSFDIGRFNTCENTALPDLYSIYTATVLFDSKVLPDGGVLVVTAGYPPYLGWVIIRIDTRGQVIRAYADFFSYDLTPERTSFWAQSTDSSYELRKIAMATGETLSVVLPPEENWIGWLAVYNKVQHTVLELLDPVSELLTGQNLSQITPNVDTLATTGTEREGVAADGVAKLVLRYPVSGPGMVQFSLVDEDGNALPNQAENGTLSNIDGAPGDSTVSVNTITTSAGEMAFAVYTAPVAFVRAGPTTAQDKQAFERGAPFVHVKPVFIPTGGTMIEGEKVRIKIKRPLVFLVHGIWSCKSTWDNFKPRFLGSPFPIRFVDYRDMDNGPCIASQDFVTSAGKVYAEIKREIEDFKKTAKVAMIQADVVAHSMGGVVTRTMALDVQFMNDLTYPTFGKGLVRRLVTIGTPHKGTPMANLAFETPCVGRFFDDNGQPTGNGAIRDLTVGSNAIQQLNNPATPTPFPVHMIVGLANKPQVDDANNKLNFFIDFLQCPGNAFKGVDKVHQVKDHDIMVPDRSQRSDRNSPTSSRFSPVTHSDPFDGPRELDHPPIVDKVIELLNDNDSTHFHVLP